MRCVLRVADIGPMETKKATRSCVFATRDLRGLFDLFSVPAEVCAGFSLPLIR
jgi:hypothetical protein